MKKIIKDIIEERKASKTSQSQGDFLDHLLVEVEREESILHEATAIDLVVGLLFAAHETTPSLMTLGTMFISDHPHVLAELTVIWINQIMKERKMRQF
jgi:cytochrome P450